MTLNDPKAIVDQSKMSALQILVVGLCVFLNAIDGFDVLSISFAAPGISADWGISRGALGIVLSMELIGMAFGSVIIGDLADRFGRRPIILLCLVIMSLGMFGAAASTGIVMLSAFRFFTGIGIGGMLASTNAMVAEFANAKRRTLCVTIMATGFPLGAIVGGAIASSLFGHYNWPSVFVFGAIVTTCFIPVIWFLLPESIEYSLKKRTPNSLSKINATLKKMGHATVESLPVQGNKPKMGLSRLFKADLLPLISILTIAYFFHIMTFYFILKWIPKIVVDMGFQASLAGSVLVWANVGGAIGAILLGLLTQKFSTRAILMVTMIFAFVMVGVFGRGYDTLFELALVAAATGFFTNAGVVGLYALLASRLPTEVRAGGTGFVIGIGRGGAALGPILAGWLFESGQSLQFVAIVMALGSIAAFIALMFLPKPIEDTSAHHLGQNQTIEPSANITNAPYKNFSHKHQ